MPELLDRIKQEIDQRIEELRPAAEEYELQETMLAIIEGDAQVVATTRQRTRKQRQRQFHNNDQQHVAYLSDEQVAEMRQEARRKKIGLPRLMERHGYVQDDRGWRHQ